MRMMRYRLMMILHRPRQRQRQMRWISRAHRPCLKYLLARAWVTPTPHLNGGTLRPRQREGAQEAELAVVEEVEDAVHLTPTPTHLHPRPPSHRINEVEAVQEQTEVVHPTPQTHSSQAGSTTLNPPTSPSMQSQHRKGRREICRLRASLLQGLRAIGGRVACLTLN